MQRFKLAEKSAYAALGLLLIVVVHFFLFRTALPLAIGSRNDLIMWGTWPVLALVIWLDFRIANFYYKLFKKEI